MEKSYKFISLLLMGALFAFTAPVMAGEVDPAEFQAAPEPPDLPDPIESGEAIEPEVTIIQREDGVIEEYRINGQLYMAKITPSVGPSYYIIDRDGDGQMESRMSDIYNDFAVPQWVLFRW